MENTIADKEKSIELKPIFGEEAAEYGVVPTSAVAGSSKQPKRGKAKELTSYPAPRSYMENYLTGEEQSRELIPQYKQQIIDIVLEQRGLAKTEKQIADLDAKLIEAQDASTILSTLSHTSSGDTIDRVLSFIPEMLYRQNIKYGTLSDGRALRALPAVENLQLSLFLEVEEQPLSSLSPMGKAMREGTAVIPYNRAEWAKHIFATDKPQNSQKKRLDKIIQQLKDTKIMHPLKGGYFAFLPLIESVEIANPTTGEYMELFRLHPAFTLAITQGRGITSNEKFVLCPPVRLKAKYFTNKLEWRLSARLDELYSKAHSAIKAKAAKGEREFHREGIESLLKIIAKDTKHKRTGKSDKGGTHLSRTLQEVRVAFAKMEQLGVIAPNTFKENKTHYYWEWNPDYLK